MGYCDNNANKYSSKSNKLSRYDVILNFYGDYQEIQRKILEKIVKALNR